jgi:hypothetical protein
VLGLRTFAIGTKDSFDVVVPLGSMIERLARLAAGIAEPAGAEVAAVVQVTLPMEVNTMTWAAISPPRGGWRSVGEADGDRLEFVARAGIEEIATEIPTGTGEQIVHRVRAEVWGRPIDGVEHVPAGGAFAAVSLGFLRAGDPVKVYETGPWTRLSTQHGHVLIKRRAWTLQR